MLWDEEDKEPICMMCGFNNCGDPLLFKAAPQATRNNPEKPVDRMKGIKTEPEEVELVSKFRETVPEEKLTETLTAATNKAPPRPAQKADVWKYFEENKDQIISDYAKMNQREFLTYWHLASTTWLTLKRLWHIKNKRQRKKIQDSAETGSNLVHRPYRRTQTTTPEFPEFSSEWDTDVQVEWLECIANIRIKEIEVRGKI
jgi:hypothetical protein